MTATDTELLWRLPADLLAEIYRQLQAEAGCRPTPDQTLNALLEQVRERLEWLVGEDRVSDFIQPLREP